MDTNGPMYVSLKIKVMTGIILIGFAIGALGVAATSIIVGKVIDRQYADKADCLGITMAASLDKEEVAELAEKVIAIYEGVEDPITSDDWGSDAFNSYVAEYSQISEDPLFLKLREDLRMYQDKNGVDCTYLGLADTDRMLALYLVDADYEDPCPPGCADKLYDMNAEAAKTMSPWPAYQTNEPEYGWLITAASPVCKVGKYVVYAENDISMDDIKEEERMYVTLMTILMSLVVGIAIFISLKITDALVVKPIQAITDTAAHYCKENGGVERHYFEHLKVSTNDEIAELLYSMKQMERDMNNNIKTLISTKEELKDTQTELEETAIKADEMTEAATKDGLTHVGNKAAYELAVDRLGVEMLDPACKFGVVMIDLNFLKRINDTYGHDIGDMAIQSLCTIVCDVFAYSPVYRIGGDEFVVIVKNRDYENIESLLEKIRGLLNESDPTLAPYEAVSAAVGYAEFTEGDSEYKDVFKRADDDMYRIKKRMHGVRA